MNVRNATPSGTQDALVPDEVHQHLELQLRSPKVECSSVPRWSPDSTETQTKS